MFRFLKNSLLWIVFLLLAAGSYLFLYGNSFGEDALKAQVSAPVQTEIPSLNATLVQVNEQTGNRRILECTENGCTPNNPPDSVGINPLSDGTNWYRYAEHVQKNGSKVSVLEKVDSKGNKKTITEENPLVRPRAMMISTDGTKIAYFLDNVHDDSDLTELWVYDNNEGGAKVVAEKLHRPDIASRVRWNASSRVVWFLQDGVKKEFIAASLGGNGASPHFAGIDWNEHAKAADTGVMDINDDASLIAFAEPTDNGFSRLMVSKGNDPSIQKTIKGKVVFIRWMEHNELLYAVQEGKNLSFWMANTKKEWPITRMSAVFQSAHSAGSSGLAAFVASPREDESHLYVLQIATGLIKDETLIPKFDGTTYLVQTSEANAASPSVEGMSTKVDDGALVAFLEEHTKDMAHDSSATPTRILITDVPNTAFVDYTDVSGAEQRILVAVVDIMNPEWKVIAKYTTINGIWKRSDASGDTDPKAVRLYEWEESLSQWILKQTF